MSYPCPVSHFFFFPYSIAPCLWPSPHPQTEVQIVGLQTCFVQEPTLTDETLLPFSISPSACCHLCAHKPSFRPVVWETSLPDSTKQLIHQLHLCVVQVNTALALAQSKKGLISTSKTLQRTEYIPRSNLNNKSNING